MKKGLLSSLLLGVCLAAPALIAGCGKPELQETPRKLESTMLPRAIEARIVFEESKARGPSSPTGNPTK